MRAGSGSRGAGGGLDGRTGLPSQRGSGVRPPPGGERWDRGGERGRLRYEGHRPKHARLRNHGRPSPPHARHPGNVQDATAPCPLRYVGHRTKHARLHNHGRPSPPHARHSGNVQDATAPMPTKTGRSVRQMKGGLSEAYSYPSLAQSLLAFPHSRSYGRGLKPGPPGFFGAHERHCDSGNDITGAPDDGGFVAQPGWFPVPRFTSYRIRAEV